MTIEEPSQSESSQEAPKGRRICSWCKKDMGPVETEMDSHTICEECRAKYFPEHPRKSEQEQ